jgi:CRISPR-associated protein Cmr1
MQSITFECEVITPMFLAGADGSTPELRPPSIKGALRFWWRALNGHLPLSDLKKMEGEIFGDTEKRSSIVIKPCIIKNIEEVQISNTPHHNRNYYHKDNNNCNFGNNGNSCFKSKKRKARLYKFELDIIFNPTKITEILVKALITNTFLLGGIGKRSRRGFGSVSISQIKINNGEWEEYLMPSNLNEINQLLDDNFKLDNAKITSQNFSCDYPSIKEIQIGKLYENYQSLLEDIGLQSHNFNGYKDYHLGFAKKIPNPNNKKEKNKKEMIRMASPIYVSVFKDNEDKFYPIITTLNTVFEKDVIDFLKTKKTTNQSTEFIKSLCLIEK